MQSGKSSAYFFNLISNLERPHQMEDSGLRHSDLESSHGDQDTDTGRRHTDPSDPEATPNERTGAEEQGGGYDDAVGGRSDEVSTDDDTDGMRGHQRRPPRDASFTTDGRGAYRLLPSPTVSNCSRVSGK